MLKKVLLLVTALLGLATAASAQENFVGAFAEPRDGGNLDTKYSSFDGAIVTIVPRAHASEALGGATRWRNVLFAIRGMKGKSPVFRLPLTSPGSGKMILQGDSISFQQLKPVWSYEPNAVKWNEFDTYARSGSGSSTWKVEARNAASFTEDVVYVSINEHFPVGDFYEWIEADVLTHPWVRPTPSESAAGSFLIGYQSGAPAGAAFSRAIPDMPLYGFVIKDPAASPKKLVMLVSGQHPYEGQTKVALQAAVDWILKSDSDEAKAYRAEYLTVVYPFVNPTGELAGLWRGTAYGPSKDTNRNWHTSETVPSRNRAIDTVIVHKNAMKKDIAALGLGEPYAIFDYHQNFGDKAPKLDYVLHPTYSSSSSVVSRRAVLNEFTPFYQRLNALTGISEIGSDLTSQETLRGYMTMRGATLPLTFERSVYNTIASEWAFGQATMKALVDPALLVPSAPVIVEPAPEPVVEDPTPEEPVVEAPQDVPTEEPVVEAPAEPTEPATPVDPEPEAPAPVENPPAAGPTVVLSDGFSASGGVLNRRIPDGVAPTGAEWRVESGLFTLTTTGETTTVISSRAVIETGVADAQVAATVRTGSNPTGLILRSSSSSNYLRFVISSKDWALQKTAGGSTSTLTSGKQAFAMGVDHLLVATLNGTTITLTIDGAVVKTIDVAFNESATRHGLLSNGSGERFWDIFQVSSLAANP